MTMYPFLAQRNCTVYRDIKSQIRNRNASAAVDVESIFSAHVGIMIRYFEIRMKRERERLLRLRSIVAVAGEVA
jgi:hypothetical protein